KDIYDVDMSATPRAPSNKRPISVLNKVDAAMCGPGGVKVIRSEVLDRIEGGPADAGGKWLGVVIADRDEMTWIFSVFPGRDVAKGWGAGRQIATKEARVARDDRGSRYIFRYIFAKEEVAQGMRRLRRSFIWFGPRKHIRITRSAFQSLD
ncbi:hypothetical protein GOODEAATRI_033457, partial [Goodea atripinnis]